MFHIEYHYVSFSFLFPVILSGEEVLQLKKNNNETMKELNDRVWEEASKQRESVRQ